VRCSQRLDQPGGDELAERGLGYADVASLAVLAQADEADTPIGDEAPWKSLGRAKQFGSLDDGEQPVGLRQRHPPPATAEDQGDGLAAGPAGRPNSQVRLRARRSASP